MNGIIITFFIINQLLHGFALSLCAFVTMKHIFYRNVKNYILFSGIMGVILCVSVTLMLLLSMQAKGDIMFVFVPLMVLSGWYFTTDRSKDALISLIFATVFSQSVIGSVNTIVFSLTTYMSVKFVWMEFVAYIVIYILSIALLILLKFIVSGKEREPLSKWNMLLLASTFSVMVFVVQVVYLKSEYASDVSSSAAIPTTIIFLFVAAVVMLSVKNGQTKYLRKINILNEEYLTIQAHHFEKVRQSDIEMRMLRHDMKNHIICLNNLYKGEKYDEMGEYLSRLTETVNEIESNIITGNEIADAIISEKLGEAKKTDAEIVVDGDFTGLSIASIHLCTILSNLLDNAIEAISLVPIKNREIILTIRKTGSFMYISVKNPTKEYVEISDNLETKKMDKDNHGFGLKNVKKAVADCGGTVQLESTKEADKYMFTAEVVLPMKQ